MPFSIVYGDITEMAADAIVNAANSGLRRGGGVCGAIFRAAGADDMAAACARIGRCEVGEVVFTPGFRLPAKYVIHTVGPVWQGGGQHEEALLSIAEPDEHGFHVPAARHNCVSGARITASGSPSRRRLVLPHSGRAKTL